MPKRYYCDFCDKSFQDNPRNRSKHMKGFFHLRNKEMHYKNMSVGPLPPEEQHRLMVFHSPYSGEELFQQWLKEHPAVVKKYEELSLSENSVKEKLNADSKCLKSDKSSLP